MAYTDNYRVIDEPYDNTEDLRPFYDALRDRIAAAGEASRTAGPPLATPNATFGSQWREEDETPTKIPLEMRWNGGAVDPIADVDLFGERTRRILDDARWVNNFDQNEIAASSFPDHVSWNDPRVRNIITPGEADRWGKYADVMKRGDVSEMRQMDDYVGMPQPRPSFIDVIRKLFATAPERPIAPREEPVIRNPTAFDNYMAGMTPPGPGLEDMTEDIIGAILPFVGRGTSVAARAGLPAARGGTGLEAGRWFPRRWRPAQLEGEAGLATRGPGIDMPGRMVNPKWDPQQTFRYRPPAQLGESAGLLPGGPPGNLVPGRGPQGLLSGQRPQWADLVDYLNIGAEGVLTRGATKALPGPQGLLPTRQFTLPELLAVLKKLGPGAGAAAGIYLGDTGVPSTGWADEATPQRIAPRATMPQGPSMWDNYGKDFAAAMHTGDPAEIEQYINATKVW